MAKNLWCGDIEWSFECSKCGEIYRSGVIEAMSPHEEIPLERPPIGWNQINGLWYCPGELIDVRSRTKDPFVTRELLRIEFGA